MNNTSKKDSFWEHAFMEYKILDVVKNVGKFELSALQIKKLGEEPRLMTKFDNSVQLPNILKKHKLSILPITRGRYIIAPYETFCNFPDDSDISNVQHVDFPDEIESISPLTITSESNAISCAYLSGILEDFVEDNNLRPTINGRMKSNEFIFNIKNNYTNNYDNINICNSQIEIDGGYEGIESLTLIEAKNNIADDFIVRQLYYPMRRWKNEITKKINTIYLVYSNNIFHLYEYKFEDENNYNSLVLNKYKKYSFEKLNISINDIQKILDDCAISHEPIVPFPQADKFERVINLVELLGERVLTKEDITNNYAFDKRQTDYYLNACKYLGLCIENKSFISLSETGNKILNYSYRDRQLELIKLILSHKVYNEVLKETFNKGTIIDREMIIQIMKNSNLHNISSKETYHRRASTIMAWINWILSRITD